MCIVYRSRPFNNLLNKEYLMNDKVAGIRELIPVPFQLNDCKVEGQPSDKDRLAIHIPWHKLGEKVVVYDLTLAVTKPDGAGAWVVENELLDQTDETSESGSEHWEILDVLISPESRQLLPDNLKNPIFSVFAERSKSGGRAKVLILFQGK